MRFDSLLEDVIEIAHEAGKAILEVYRTPFDTQTKSDASPVTLADEKAERLILERLGSLTPHIPIVSEEAAAAGYIPEVDRQFWLVDPLDGTKEFISRNGEFTVNIALIEDRRPTLGVVLAPALNRLFAGAIGTAPFIEEHSLRRTIACRTVPAEGLTVVASRSHADPAALGSFLANRRIASYASVGSSLKFCLVATGEADIYPRLGRTMEWDIAAGHAVLAAAGGRVSLLNGDDMTYGKPGFANPHFIAVGLTGS